MKIECAFSRPKARWETLKERNVKVFHFIPSIFYVCCVLPYLLSTGHEYNVEDDVFAHQMARNRLTQP